MPRYGFPFLYSGIELYTSRANSILLYNKSNKRRKYVLLFLCQISYFTAVVLRCPFKISSTAIEDIYFGPCSISAVKSQYFSSKKPKHWTDKVSTLIWLTQRIVFANAPHCLFRLPFIAHHSPLIVHHSPFIVHHSHPHKNRQYEYQGNDGEEQSTACLTAKENQKRSSCPSIRNSTDFILRKQWQLAYVLWSSNSFLGYVSQVRLQFIEHQ